MNVFKTGIEFYFQPVLPDQGVSQKREGTLGNIGKQPDQQPNSSESKGFQIPCTEQYQSRFRILHFIKRKNL